MLNSVVVGCTVSARKGLANPQKPPNETQLGGNMATKKKVVKKKAVKKKVVKKS